MVNTQVITLFCLAVYSDFDDLFDVRQELITVCARWKSIGIALRLKPSTLDSIQARNSGDLAACSTSMLIQWLTKNYHVERFGEPTWQRLVEAVAHPAGGENMALAREIARRHKARGMSNRYIYCTVGNVAFCDQMQTHTPRY